MKLNLRLDGVMWTQTTENKWSDEEDDKKEKTASKDSVSPEKT